MISEEPFSDDTMIAVSNALQRLQRSVTDAPINGNDYYSISTILSSLLLLACIHNKDSKLDLVTHLLSPVLVFEMHIFEILD